MTYQKKSSLFSFGQHRWMLILALVVLLQSGCGFVYFDDGTNCTGGRTVCNPVCQTYCDFTECWDECYDDCWEEEPVCTFDTTITTTDDATTTTTKKEDSKGKGKKNSDKNDKPKKEEKNHPEVKKPRGDAGLCQVCDTDSDCFETDAKCVQINYSRISKTGEKVCGRNCRVNSDCPTSFECVRISDSPDGLAQCIPQVTRVDGERIRTCSAEPGLECVSALDCAAGESCSHNRCVNSHHNRSED